MGPVFTCSVCGFSAPYQRHGRTLDEPSDTRKQGYCTVLLEECFLVADPSASSRRPLVLGSLCSACSKPVCPGETCSLFYAHRFCAPCAAAAAPAFPPQVLRAAARLFSSQAAAGEQAGRSGNGAGEKAARVQGAAGPAGA
ncbi:cysteine-rich domain-containing protein [Haematococcus lacustris]